MYVLIKTDNDIIPLINCQLSIYKNNIYITSSNHNDMFNFLYKFKNTVFNKISIITDDTLYVIKTCTLQDIKLVNSNININIIGDKIINCGDPKIYVRFQKIRKIINKRNG